MECKRCGNKDPTYFYKGSKGYYCRKCVMFKRILLDEDLNKLDYNFESIVNGQSYYEECIWKIRESYLKEKVKKLNYIIQESNNLSQIYKKGEQVGNGKAFI